MWQQYHHHRNYWLWIVVNLHNVHFPYILFWWNSLRFHSPFNIIIIIIIKRRNQNKIPSINDETVCIIYNLLYPFTEKLSPTRSGFCRFYSIVKTTNFCVRCSYAYVQHSWKRENIDFVWRRERVCCVCRNRDCYIFLLNFVHLKFFPNGSTEYGSWF